MATERKWEISDIDGTNKRQVTLAEFRAELDARKKMTAPIMDAIRRGDIEGATSAQKAMRKVFPK